MCLRDKKETWYTGHDKTSKEDFGDSLMNCIACSTPMKPLFVGMYCPNECDRPKNTEVVSGSSYGLFLYSFAHPKTNRVWDVYRLTKTVNFNNWIGWYCSRIDETNINDFVSAKHYPGEMKSSNNKELFEKYYTPEKEYSALRFVPQHQTDIEKYPASIRTE